MSFDNIFFAAICWVCSAIFGSISLWSFKRRDPMHFWSGSTVNPEEIEDIPAYNRANGLMWAIYAICIAAAGILSLFSTKIGVVLLIIICVPGLFVLIAAYNHIYSKYKNKSFIYDTNRPKPKTPKAVVIAIIVISVITFVVVVAVFYYGEEEPAVTVFDSGIQINAMYGLDIGLSEITDIPVIETRRLYLEMISALPPK